MLSSTEVRVLARVAQHAHATALAPHQGTQAPLWDEIGEIEQSGWLAVAWAVHDAVRATGGQEGDHAAR